MKKLSILVMIFIMALTVPLQASAASLYEIRKILREDYYGEFSGDIFDAQTIQELMSMVKDPYTVYFTSDEYRQFYQSIEQQTVGIGVVVNAHEKGVLVSEIISNGPAANAGIKAGDIITQANNVSLVGLPLNEAISHITGAENTTVSLQILRADGSTQSLSIVRKTIQTPNIVSSLLHGNVGYIYLASFSDNGALEVSNAVRKLKQLGATSFILDLQQNGGGYVETAIDLMSLFPNAQNAFQLIDHSGTYLYTIEDEKTYGAKYYEKFTKDVAVLINSGSASASEMLAAAVKDEKLATLYGSKSYGKGSMQNIEPFRDGSALKVTIAEFRSPMGNKINQVGILPDVATATPIEAAHYDLMTKPLTNYKELPALKDVPTSKQFTITFSSAIDASTLPESIELIELGAQAVTIETTVTNNKVVITPTEPLQQSKQYALIVHPTIKNEKGKLLKAGKYMHITVAK